MWGLPTGQGLWVEHPSTVRRGLFGNKFVFGRRAPGYVKGGVMHETATWEEADRETGNDIECGPAQKSGGGYREYEKRRGYDLKLHRFDTMQTNRSLCPEGRDDGLRSVSLGEDVWHILTVQMSLPRLLMLEIYAEFFFILVGAVLLTLVAAAEGNRLDSTLLGDKLLLSFTTVRISTDSVYGWAEKTPSTKPEIVVLALLGWFHWLLLSVAGAIIVARALKPLQQVAFAPDCVMNEQEISVRMIKVRPSVMLYDLQVSMTLQASFEAAGGWGRGQCRKPLEIQNTKGRYGLWTDFPLTVKHDVTSPDSPVRNLGPDQFWMFLEITVTGIDSNGNPVFASANYHYTKSKQFVKGVGFQGAYGDRLYPRMLRGKWRDQTRPFTAANRGAPFQTPDLPIITYNMDNFHVIEHDQKGPDTCVFDHADESRL